MEERTNPWDIIFIILLCLAGAGLLFALIFPATQSFNSFKMLFGSKDGILEVTDPTERNTNILESLEENASPRLYRLEMGTEGKTLYLDENERKPCFKSFDCPEIYLEGFNPPEHSEGGFEVYGAFGLEIMLPEGEDGGGELLSAIPDALGDGLYIPYFYSKIRREGEFLAALDLFGSSIKLERLTDGEFKEVASVSGRTFERVLSQNGGTALLRNGDGTLFLDSGVYRLTLSFAQISVSATDEGASVLRREPSVFTEYLNVNTHECSRGVLIAENADASRDIQLNALTDSDTVCYPAGAEIRTGGGITLGVSLSAELLERLSGISGKAGLSLTLKLLRYDTEADSYTEIESREIMDGSSIFVNNTFTFDGESYKTGKYRIIVDYESRLDKIEQVYDYYFKLEV